MFTHWINTSAKSSFHLISVRFLRPCLNCLQLHTPAAVFLCHLWRPHCTFNLCSTGSMWLGYNFWFITVTVQHSHASFDMCNLNIALCKWKSMRCRCSRGKGPPLLTEPHSLFSLHSKVRCGKSELFHLPLLQSPEDLHSLFFMRKPECRLSGLSHGGQATKFTFGAWQKHPRTTNTDQRFGA